MVSTSCTKVLTSSGSLEVNSRSRSPELVSPEPSLNAVVELSVDIFVVIGITVVILEATWLVVNTEVWSSVDILTSRVVVGWDGVLLIVVISVVMDALTLVEGSEGVTVNVVLDRGREVDRTAPVSCTEVAPVDGIAVLVESAPKV